MSPGQRHAVNHFQRVILKPTTRPRNAQIPSVTDLEICSWRVLHSALSKRRLVFSHGDIARQAEPQVERALCKTEDTDLDVFAKFMKVPQMVQNTH